MSVRPSDLIFFAGSECLDRYGVLVRRTHPSEDVPETFARASTAYYVTKTGLYAVAEADTPRVHYRYLDGAYTPTLLLEGTSKNLLTRSQDFGTDWITVGTPLRTAASITIGDLVLDELRDDDAGGPEYWYQSPTFTGNGKKGVSIFVAQADATSACLRLVDVTAAAARLDVAIGWAAGLPSVTVTTGEYLGFEFVPGVANVFRMLFRSTAVTAANSHVFEVRPAATDAGSSALTGATYMGGAQVEDVQVPTSYIKTVAATVTRAGERFEYAHPHAPQAITMYTKFVENGDRYVTGIANRLLEIGNGIVVPLMAIYAADDGYACYLHNAAADTGATVAGASIGTQVELSFTVTAASVLTISKSENGGAETSAVAPITLGLPAGWPAGTVVSMCGQPGGGSPTHASHLAAKIALGNYSLSEMRAAN